MNDDVIVIGIDHGYGNIKTANTCFKTGVETFDKEPIFKSNLLIFKDKFYTISAEHKEFVSNKSQDDEFYILTLAAVARELNIRKITKAKVHLAAGLPLTWVSEQKESFKKYLLQNDKVEFTYKGVDYSVEFVGADVFPQGFSAVAAMLSGFNGVNLIADIGNGTMNIMYINDRKPIQKKCFTEKFGTHQCMLVAKENILKKFGVNIDELVIEKVLRHGKAEVPQKYLNAIEESAKEYVNGIFRRLREREYDEELMKLFVVGGGGCLIKNFAKYDENRVSIIEDICATAKGYEFLAKGKLAKNRSIV